MLGVVRCGTGPSPRVRARAPPVQNIFFAVVTNVAYTRFEAGKDIMDALVLLGKKRRAGGAGGSSCWRASPGDAALGHTLR